MDTRITSLRPGQEILTDPVYGVALDTQGSIAPSRQLLANLHRYQLYTALLLGGHRVLLPPGGTLHPLTGDALHDNSYLRRLPGETSVQGTGGNDAGQDAWLNRRNSSAHDPVAARCLMVYVDTLYRQQIDRSAVAEVLGQDVLDDIDLHGTPAQDWLPQAYAWGLAQGWCAALIDLPELDLTDYPSLGHLAGAGQRPYVQLVLPTRFWEIELDRFGRVARALVLEAADRWRLWQGSYSVLLDQHAEPLGPQQEHSFGRPPFELFLAQDPDPDDPLAPLGESAMAATALLDLQILQQSSLEDDLHRKVSFPFLHVRRDREGASSPSGNVMLGPDLIYAVDADVDWKAPPSDLANAVRVHIDDLEARVLKIAGVHRRSQESVEAHSGLALDWENAPIYATVQRWARRMHSWEVRIWRLMARGMKRDPRGIEVIYPDDFSTRPIDQDLSQAKAIADIYGTYDAAPDFARAGIDAKVRRALGRDVGHVPGVRELLAEPLDADDYEEPETETPPPSEQTAELMPLMDEEEPSAPESATEAGNGESNGNRI